jgi:UDP-2,3-diacylglucosamine pyrophosphatase LpxH
MITFISDLHFTDGTTTKKKINVNMFKDFLSILSGKCKLIEKQGGHIEEIKLVFLGDIFDLFRSSIWLDASEEERPWGCLYNSIESRSNDIFDNLIKENQEIFDLLSRNLKDEFNFPYEPIRIFIPGNHDRLCNEYESIRHKVCKWLNIPEIKGPFPTSILEENYGVFARHGHEFDSFNYEGLSEHRFDDYRNVSIGDVNTTELIEKFTWKLMKNPDIQILSDKEKSLLWRNFEEMDEIRPISSVIKWLTYQISDNLSIQNIIRYEIKEIIDDYNNLFYVKDWHKKHNHWYLFFDLSDKIRLVLFFLKYLNIFKLRKFLEIIEKLKFWNGKDIYIKKAEKEIQSLSDKVQYIVYGHTHIPKKVPLKIVDDKEYFYFNTGTWNKTFYRTIFDSKFVSLKYLSYVMFYSPNEVQSKYPQFEMNSTFSNSIVNVK